MAECPEQWKLDVNDRYQAAVGVVTGMSATSMVLPVFFLKDMVGAGTVLSVLTASVYSGWFLLGVSVLSGIAYYYCSAKWVKLAWKRKTDMFGIKVGEGCVETCLDLTYFLMMTGFVIGLACIIYFMITFVPISVDD
jgi:hypothetical protein